MPPPSLWSGNLRLSLVIIPVNLSPAITNEDAVSFRMIHEPSGKPIRYVKGVRDGEEFVEVPEEEIVKGYEHAKGHHVLISPVPHCGTFFVLDLPPAKSVQYLFAAWLTL